MNKIINLLSFLLRHTYLKRDKQELAKECDRLMKGYLGAVKLLDEVHKKNPEVLPTFYSALDVDGFGKYYFK